MRIAVVSDIHANLHALEAVLADIDRESVDEVWCLGDLVGYGPRPNECVDLTRARATISLCGNHDLGVLGGIPLGEFSPEAADAARWTREVLGESQRDWLAGLQPTAQREGAELFHGSPRDPVWDYILTDDDVYASLRMTTAPLVLVGHSHIAFAVSSNDAGLDGGLAPAGTDVTLGDRRRLLNPGSVGQPRDRDPRAAWLLLDTGPGRASFRRVEYPIETTQGEMAAAGLPPTLAARLAHGI